MFTRPLFRMALTSVPLCWLLTGCGSSGSADQALPPAPTYTLGGTVSGSTGALTLRNNANQETLTVAAAGAFTFPTARASGTAYDIVVATPPNGQSCTVANGSGTLPPGNVNNIAVTCTTNGLSLGGTVSGLASGATLQLRATAPAVLSDLTLNANGGFTFPVTFLPSATYEVFVLTQPNGQTCSVAPETGSFATTNLTNLTVTCTNNSASTRTWRNAVNLATDNDLADQNNHFKPAVAVNAGGSALAVWTEDDINGPNENLRWSYRPAGGSWTAPATIPPRDPPPPTENPVGELRRNPVLVMRADGSAICAWEQIAGGSGIDVMASVFTPANGWSTPETLWAPPPDTNSGTGIPLRGAENLQIQVDAQGRVLLVWEALGNLYFNRHLTGSGWIPTLLNLGIQITEQNALYAREVHLAMNAAGQAVILWRGSDAGDLEPPFLYSLYSNRYDPATNSWGPALPVGSITAVNFFGESVVLDGNGEAMALWSESEGDRLRVRYNRLTGNTWGTPAQLETGNTLPQGFAMDPHAVIDGSGHVVAVWRQGDLTTGEYLANRYVPGTGWGTQQVIGEYAGSSSPRFDTDIVMAGNAAGHVVVTWTLVPCVGAENQLCPPDLNANEYNPTNGEWGVEEPIDKEALFPGEIQSAAAEAAVAVDAAGNAIAIWEQLGVAGLDGIRTADFR